MATDPVASPRAGADARWAQIERVPRAAHIAPYLVTPFHITPYDTGRLPEQAAQRNL